MLEDNKNSMKISYKSWLWVIQEQLISLARYQIGHLQSKLIVLYFE